MRINLARLIARAPAAALVALLSSSAPATPLAPGFQGLGFAGATAMSDDGTVLVGGTDRHAFRWTRATGVQDLGDLPGATRGALTFSVATDVSADGSIVVGYAPNRLGLKEAFRWTSAGGMQGLGSLPGGDPTSHASGISADGSVIVGGTGLGSNAGDQAFRWTSAGGMQGLGFMAGGDTSYASDVSADGSTIVGGGSSLQGYPPFRWTSAGGMQFLSGGAFWDSAGAVNRDGSVVVGDSAGRAFRWTSAGGMEFLDPLGGWQYSIASDVSGDGSIVLGWRSNPSGGESFIWDATHGMRSVRQALTNEYGFDLSGWRDLTPTAISDDGRTLAGFGINPLGIGEAWMATVPEPSSLALLAVACVSLFRRQGPAAQRVWGLSGRARPPAASSVHDCHPTRLEQRCAPRPLT